MTDDKLEPQAAAQAIETGDAEGAGFWLALAGQRRKLGLAARRLLSQRGPLVQQIALRGVPDVSIDTLQRLAHGAIVAQGGESWTASVGGHRVHRYAFTGSGQGPAILLVHGLGGSGSSMAALVPGLVALAPRVILLELPGHGRSPAPARGPLSAREYGQLTVAVVEEMAGDYGKVSVVGNSLGGAIALFVAHERPDLCAAVVGLNPAGAELSPEAMNALPRSFEDPNGGAMRMAEMLFHRTPWLFWLVARDFARNWGTPTVQRILDDARAGSDRSLGLDFLGEIRVPSLIVWGAEDRLLPRSSAEHFRRSIPGVRVELLPACGHVPQLERPALTRKLVTDFLRNRR